MPGFCRSGHICIIDLSQETLSSQSTYEYIKKEVLALSKEKVDLQAEIEKHSGSHKVLQCPYFLAMACFI